ncbi:carbon storage regulator [Planctomicrobium sp. SH527]|uniref:carbon storage regulator n=1 Tax=Planctomicrobium sp. SH527 TaxID=3448123 RepID=UPI003F5B1739
MLVLTRKPQQSIRIGDEIEVVVLEIQQNRVRLGFRCPKSCQIVRSELLHMDDLNDSTLRSDRSEIDQSCYQPSTTIVS